MATKWPDEVPVLEANDFCRGAETRGERHCLTGWASRVFFATGEFVDNLICETAIELGAYKANEALHYVAPPVVNDSPRNSRELLARIWNRAMAKLGYVVNNPEAKYLKKKA